MEYDMVLEEKSNAQSERIIDLKASVDGQTFLTNTTYYTAIAVSIWANKELTEIWEMMKQISAFLIAQAATVATFSTNINGGESGAGRNTNKKKAGTGFYVFVHCKQEVYRKGGNCLDLEANRAKSCPG